MSTSVLLRAPLARTFTSPVGRGILRSLQGESCFRFYKVRANRLYSETYVYTVCPWRTYAFLSLAFETPITRHLAIYKGTVNDPTTFPPPSKTHGSYHWAFERLLAASLVPMTAAAFVTSGSSYPVLDGVLGLSLVMHSHIGVRRNGGVSRRNELMVV